LKKQTNEVMPIALPTSVVQVTVWLVICVTELTLNADLLCEAPNDGGG
jgi:hypothetical protein